MTSYLVKDLGKVITGNTPSKNKVEYYNSEDIGFVKPDIMSDSQIIKIELTNEFISEQARSKARIVGNGAVFVTCIGSIGKVGIAGEGEYAFNQQINAIEPNGRVLSQYLAYCLFFNRKRLVDISNSPVVPIINKTQFENFTINISEDLFEQQKIIENLNKVNNLISLAKQQLKELDNLIKAQFVEMFGDPEYNTKEWEIFKLEDLCSIGSSKRIYQNEQSTVGIPFLRISDLVNRIDTDSKECELFIPEERYNKLVEEGLVPTVGDILVTSRGTLGKCYIIDENDKFYFQDGMISWLSNFRENITAVYILYLFMMQGFRKQIDNLQSGSTVAYLSISMLKKLNIMIPDIELQEQFATFVQQIDKSKVVIQKSLDETQLLFDSLMQKYFG